MNPSPSLWSAAEQERRTHIAPHRGSLPVFGLVQATFQDLWQRKGSWLSIGWVLLIPLVCYVLGQVLQGEGEATGVARHLQILGIVTALPMVPLFVIKGFRMALLGDATLPLQWRSILLVAKFSFFAMIWALPLLIPVFNFFYAVFSMFFLPLLCVRHLKPFQCSRRLVRGNLWRLIGSSWIIWVVSLFSILVFWIVQMGIHFDFSHPISGFSSFFWLDGSICSYLSIAFGGLIDFAFTGQAFAMLDRLHKQAYAAAHIRNPHEEDTQETLPTS